MRADALRGFGQAKLWEERGEDVRGRHGRGLLGKEGRIRGVALTGEYPYPSLVCGRSGPRSCARALALVSRAATTSKLRTNQCTCIDIPPMWTSLRGSQDSPRISG